MEASDSLASVKDARALAQAIVDTIREPLLVLDQRLHVIGASRSFYSTFIVEPRDVEARPIYDLGDGQWNISELRELLENVLPQRSVMEAYEVTHNFPRIGSRTMLLNARQLIDERTAQKLILLAMEDVTHRRFAEQVMKDMVREKEILLQEMQHRVANSLQVIASILLLKARSVSSEETRAHLQEAHQRVMSVATVQEQLHASGHGEQIELGPYLRRLCETLAASMIGDGRPTALSVHAATGTASSAHAVSMGLIVTELVINALKHAFPANAHDRRIVVAYQVDKASWRLSVSDNGVGATKSRPDGTPPGLGTKIVEALARQLGGRVEVSAASPGTIVSIIHP